MPCFTEGFSLNRVLSIALLLLVCVANPVVAEVVAQNNFFERFGGLGAQEQLLAEDIAFQILETKVEGKELVIAWESAVDYYLYKKNFKIQSLHPGVKVGELILPKGELENDPLFGNVEVYFGSVVVRAPLQFDDFVSGEVAFNVYSQGCNKPVGVCYPPQKRLISISLSADQTELATNFATENTSTEIQANKESDLNTLQKVPEDRSVFMHVLIAFGIGILLVFTPCVLPMIPILSGLVVGRSTSRSKAVFLSIAYVLGTAITYTITGVLAGAAGIQVQAYFQQPIFIVFMVLILLLLSASLFGLYELRLPSRWQSKITEKTNTLSASGFFMSLFVSLLIGLLSALIVSACVSPLLILVLGVAVNQASPALGGAMMFAMAWGMGIPLIMFALGAQWLLPKAGAWMNGVKQFFGFAAIAVAIIVISSIKAVPVLFLWAIWLLIIAYWLWRMSKNSSTFEGNTNKGKTKVLLLILRLLAVLVAFWGALSLVGSFYGGTQVTKPLHSVLNQQVEKLPFETVKTVADITLALEKAKVDGKPVLVDYYADWCVECVRMEQTTYRDASIAKALKNWLLIKVDVTKVNADTQAAKDLFGVFGPPATLFINSLGQEMKKLHRYGLISVDELLILIEQVTDGS